MTHVITAICLRDTACVDVCPVECIIPGTPDDTAKPRGDGYGTATIDGNRIAVSFGAQFRDLSANQSATVVIPYTAYQRIFGLNPVRISRSATFLPIQIALVPREGVKQADAMAELGIIPKEAAKKIWNKGRTAKFDVARIDAIEAEVKHDVIAFLTHLAEIVGPEARFVHQGMTSSDVLDTCFNLQLVEAADILIADVDALLAALKARAFEYKDTPTVGRSHGGMAAPSNPGGGP